MTDADWDRVAAVYQEGIDSGLATFETRVPDRKAWDRAHLPAPRLTAWLGNRLAGWAALSPVSDRCAYGGVAEVSVYVAADCRGRGVGRTLLRRLVEDSEKAGIWTLQAGLFEENEASLALHTHCGFRVVGRRERLGQLRGAWKDVLLLERRSSATGL